tara:strand:+ start:701 stop:1012 length:312 start_codon:yes stop_codon:yes gene_type:complete
MNGTPEIIDAIKALDPTAWVSCTSNDITKIHWNDGNPNNITDEQIETKLIELTEAYNALEYARNRKAEYPDWSVQLNKIYDDGLTKWKTEMVDPVKAKYPKPD